MPYLDLSTKQQFFTCRTIDTINDFEQIYNQLTNSSRRLAFRGVKEASFDIYTSAQVNAILKHKDLSDFVLKTSILAAIKEVRGSRRIMKLLNKRSKDLTDFQILALLQHYTFGTTLIDFTFQLPPSLFFALDSLNYSGNETHTDISEYFSVYYFDLDDPNHCSVQDVHAQGMLNLEAFDQEAKQTYGTLYDGLSHQTINSFTLLPYEEIAQVATGGLTILGREAGIYDLFGTSTRLRVYYDVTNERLDIQSGLFKLNPSASLSFEQAAKQWYSGYPEHIYCLNVHKSLATYINQHYIDPLKISAKSIYPKTSLSKKIIRELLKLPMPSVLRPRVCPQNLSVSTWNKYNRLYNKALKKRKKDNYTTLIPFK